jgi:hypothetical protein
VESILEGQFFLASLQDKSAHNLEIVGLPWLETLGIMQNKVFIFFRDEFLIYICDSWL